MLSRLKPELKWAFLSISLPFNFGFLIPKMLSSSSDFWVSVGIIWLAISVSLIASYVRKRYEEIE